MIDVVGPLMVTNSGYQYFSTMLGLARRFRKAIPLKERNSVAIVAALLSVCERIGSPAENSEGGSAFTSALAAMFL